MGAPNQCLRVFRKDSATDASDRDNILVSYVYLFKDAVGPDVILMNYNARPDRVHMID